MRHLFLISGVFLILLAFGCGGNDKQEVVYSKYKPVLMETDKLASEVKLLPQQENKIITLMRQSGNLMMALDYGLGLHIIDITDKENPVKKGFFQIPACIDFELKDNILYANNYKDLIVVDFSDLNNPLVTKREAAAFDVVIKTPDGLRVFDGLNVIPANTTIISYEAL